MRRMLMLLLITACCAGVALEDLACFAGNIMDPITLRPTRKRVAFTRRKPITITNGGASTLTNYAVKVTVIYDADMAADFSDLRFSNASGKKCYRYWIESKTDSTTATVWVRVPSIPTGESTIYAYYGRTGAIAASNGAAAFPFYEDDWSGVAASTVLSGHTKLTTPTPDASGEAIHPCVAYVAGGWGTANKAYWMSMTPYKDMAAAVENPSILHSDDGTAWTVPSGVTNPLIPIANEGHNCDTHLIRNDDTDEMYLYWVRSDDTTPATRLCVMKSSDGVNWTTRTGTAIASLDDAAWRTDAILGPLAGNDREWSPNIVKRGSTWHYWAATHGGSLVHRTSSDGFTWSELAVCDDGSATTSIWHFGVLYSETLAKWLLISMDASNYHVEMLSESTDGETWVRLPWPVLNSSNVATEWDAQVYRCSMVEIAGTITVFTSAYQAGAGADSWIARCTPMSVTDFYNSATGTLKDETAKVVYRRINSAATGGTAEVAAGVLTLTPVLDGTSQNSIYVRSGKLLNLASDMALRVRCRPNSNGFPQIGLGGGKQIYAGTYTGLASAGVGDGYKIIQWSDGKWYLARMDDSDFSNTGIHTSAAALTTTDAYHIWELVILSTGKVSGYLDDVIKTNHDTQTLFLDNDKRWYVADGVQGSGTARSCAFDWVLIRQRMATEPTTAVGAEASGAYKVAA